MLIACNFTAAAQTISFDLQSKQLKTLLSTPGMDESVFLPSIKLPPYGVFIGQLQ